MALLKGKFTEIPNDAVILSENDAVKYQTKVLKGWKKKSDVWAFNHGTTILASASALSGIYINNYYRLRFRLGHYGQIATYLPVCIIPAIMSFVLHSEFVLPNVILQKDCAVCLEMRATAIQAGIGSVFPVFLAPFAVSSLALRYNTYQVPYLSKEPMKVFQLWKKQTKPISNILFAIFVGQALLGSLVTYLEAKSIETVNDKLTLLGYELERQDELM